MIKERIQRKRTKGWKMPENTVYVGRPGKWGNPFKVGHKGLTPQDAVNLYGIVAKKLPVEELRGKNLACWCKIGQPCHADVLLEIANK